MTANRWFKRHWISVAVAAAFAFVGGVVWLFKGYEYLDKASQSLIRLGTIVDPHSNLVSAKPWFETVLIVAALIMAGSVGITINLLRGGRRTDLGEFADADKYKALQSEYTKLMMDHRKAQEMTDGMMAATSRIRNQLSPVGKLVKSLEYVRVTYYIHKDFSAHVVREYGIRSNREPVHFWTTENRATSHADPVGYLQDIAFEIRDDKNYKLPYLPIRNDAVAKEVVIYFLPRIEPGEPTRHVRITFTWPRYLKQIEKLGSEKFSFTFDSIDPIPFLEFSWFLEPGTGRNLVGEVMSGTLAGDIFDPSASASYNGGTWTGFSYKVKDGPSGTFKYELRARQEKP